MKTRILVIAAVGIILLWGIYSLPEFGSFQNKDVAEYYIDKGLEGTGSANLVNAIVWDFRGYDTLVEEMVLFTAAIAVILVAAGKTRKRGARGG
jgi:multisubunit Na+/H+ antiporter MnhB subunit